MKAVVISLVGLMIVGAAVAAVEGVGGEGGRGEIRDIFREAHASRKAHHEGQREENEAFREGLKDLDEDARIPAMLAHRKTQHRENEKFASKLHKTVVAAIKACDTIPDDRKTELLEKIEDRYDEATEFHEEIYDAVIDFLKDLIGDDMTPEEKRAAWKEFHEGIKEKVQAWHEEHRPKRGGRRRDSEDE